MISGLKRIVAIGEAMIELAPVGDGLYRRGFAGDTFNTAWHVSQLLGEKATVSFVSCVGTDSLSAQFVNELVADGLDVSGLYKDPSRNMGLYLIELDVAERSFHYWRQVSAAKRLAEEEERLLNALKSADLIHLSGITLAILDLPSRHRLFDVLSKCRKRGAHISFDPNVRRRLWTSDEEIRSTLSTMFGLTDIALPSFDDETGLWGDITPIATLNRMAKAGISEIAVKNGAEAVHSFAGGQECSTPTPAVSGICDTTGAGDAFNAGYLAARITGTDVPGAVALGQRMSATVIQIFGARAPKQVIRSLFEFSF